jgi:hypothetical protein
MPEYVFESSTGKRITRFYPADEAPRIGESIRHARRWYRRIPAFVIGTGRMERGSKYPYVSQSLPDTTQGCKFTKGKRKKPIIESARHEREIAARHGLTKDAACWDDCEEPK